MKHSGLLALACAAALTIGCNGRNQADNTDVGTTGSNSVSNSDKTFVHDVLSNGMAEVETAKLARYRAASPEVKQFAQMMIDDHTNAGKLLKQVAATYDIPEQPKIDDAHQALMDDLSRLNGADFDKKYIEAMIDDHEDAVKGLRSRVDENRSVTDRLQGKNPEDRLSVKPEVSGDRAKMSLNEWAANILPTVEHHRDRAKEIKDHLDHPNSTARTETGAYRAN